MRMKSQLKRKARAYAEWGLGKQKLAVEAGRMGKRVEKALVECDDDELIFISSVLLANVVGHR